MPFCPGIHPAVCALFLLPGPSSLLGTVKSGPRGDLGEKDKEKKAAPCLSQRGVLHEPHPAWTMGSTLGVRTYVLVSLCHQLLFSENGFPWRISWRGVAGQKPGSGPSGVLWPHATFISLSFSPHRCVQDLLGKVLRLRRAGSGAQLDSSLRSPSWRIFEVVDHISRRGK